MSGQTFAIVWTTVGRREEAREMARRLVEARLAACVQITQIESVYRWEGRIEQADEWLLSCKISAAEFSHVEAAIKASHPYDVPEIIMTPIEGGSAAYLDWLAAETQHDSDA